MIRVFAADVPTLYFSLAIVAAYIGLVLLASTFLSRRVRAVGLWGVAYLLIGAAIAVTLLRDTVPAIVRGSSVTLFLLASGVLLDIAVRGEDGRPDKILDYAAPVLGVIVTILFTAVMPNRAVRGTVFFLLVAILTGRTALRLVGQARGTETRERFAIRTLATFFGILATTAAILVPLAALGMRPDSVGQSGRIDVILVPIFMLFIIGAGLGQLWVRYIQAYLEVQRQATVDPLTGVRNRRYVLPEFERVFVRAIREERPLACMMLDADSFKQVNDTHGHRKGDAVLAQIASRLSCAVRDYDLVGRYGGEEFIVVAPDLDPDDAVRMAGRIHASIRTEPVDGLGVTVSIGVAFMRPDDQRPEDLIQRADLALLAAKRAGKDRVEVDSFRSAHQEQARGGTFFA